MSTYITYRDYGEYNHSRTLYAGESRKDALASLYRPHPGVIDSHGIRVLEEWIYGEIVRRFRATKEVDGSIDLEELEG